MPYAPRTHRPKKTKAKAHNARGSSTARGYDRQWRKARLVHLRMNPLCAECLKEGKTVPAIDVDHIVPISQGGARLDPENFRSLCRKHHNEKTRNQ